MKERRGSALLIVLGMLAFMVISGVAFSAFMRSSRQPSSFARRTVATRQLAKAALAEAIDQIDRSIGNDPHPNIRKNSGDKYNYWLGRVLLTPYVGTTRDGDRSVRWANSVQNEIYLRAGKSTSGESSLYNPSTVPVLTLESLAYIPPPLVNEARYYGQLSPTACWQTFDFDAGRYAYIALDVSDYFDVNRTIANEARLSSPESRVTLSYMFEEGDHSNWSGGADTWDGTTFMGQFRDVGDDGRLSFGSKIPLFSIADFNLAWGDQTIGSMKNPFVQYLKSGNGFFYKATPNPGSPGEFEKYGEMTFVTDSLDAPLSDAERKTDAGEEVWDLDDEANQPFSEAFLAKAQDQRTLTGVSAEFNRSKSGARLIKNRVPFVTMFELSDYLDRDRIPVTLAMPSVERVPMICGIQPMLGNVQIDAQPKKTDEEKVTSETTKHFTRKISWSVDLNALAGSVMSVRALYVYPFLNRDGTQDNDVSFKFDGKIQMFLTSLKVESGDTRTPMALRTGPGNDLLSWGKVGDKNSGGGNGLRESAILDISLEDSSPFSPPSTFTDPKDLVRMSTLTPKSFSNPAAGDGELLCVTYEWDAEKDEKTGLYKPLYDKDDEFFPPAGLLTDVTSKFKPLNSNGAVDGRFSGKISKDKIESLDATLQLNFAVTLRVTSDSEKVTKGSGAHTVDMVPATFDDDKAVNGIDNTMGIVFNSICGDSTPLLKFDTGVELSVKIGNTAFSSGTFKPSPASVMIDDPRYNHAPENWIVRDFSQAGDWYDNLAKSSAAGRDGDIFMATSDQTYLQSIYELAFLPRCSDLKANGSSMNGNLGPYLDGSKYWTSLGQKTAVDANHMWMTYDAYGRYDDGPDDFEGLGLANLGRGLRVNPFSDSTNVLMAAFANTPRDWVTASDQVTDKASANAVSDAREFNNQFAWNEYSTKEKLSWSVLSAVAGDFVAAVKDRAVKGDGDWRDALCDVFDQDRAYDTEKYLCGIDLQQAEFKPMNGANASLYSVDKKFLYGFWRNCFAARQQLFLVFFRAEPMMLGGGVAGVTPPQLGARGVALVWRNPNNPQNSAVGTKGYTGNNSDPFDINTGYTPHQTRVLFYKQFE